MRRVTVLAVLFVMAAIQGMLFFFPGDSLGVYFQILKPLLYLMLGIFCFIFIGKDQRTYEIRADFLLVSTLGALAYLAFLFACGYLRGFSHNPLNMSFWGIAANAWAFLTVAVMREFIRGKIMAAAKWPVLLLAALVFTFSFMDNIRSVAAFSLETKADYILTDFLPILVLNFFAVWTASMGGAAGNMLFLTVYQAVPVLSPYLPDMPKILDAIVVYTLVFIMYLIAGRLLWNRRRAAAPRGEPYHWKWLLLPAGVLTVFLLFGLGVFAYLPVAVASNSMSDVFSRGSLVIVKKIDNIDGVKVGDIIEYQSGNIAVIHRVVDITYAASGAKQFITKGDNNPAIDLYPVLPEQVVGHARWHIPYLGYPALFFSILKPV